MSYIRRLTGPHRPPPEGQALANFHAARSAINVALIDLIHSRLDPDDIALEVDGTISAIRQLVSLTVSGEPT